VVGEYGAQIHPRFGTKTFRNGIDIDVAEGTNIVAVYGGHVLYTGWFRGYGNLIIVDHGGNYYTLYAHAAEMKVREGEESSRDRRSGRSGIRARSRAAPVLRGAARRQAAGSRAVAPAARMR